MKILLILGVTITLKFHLPDTAFDGVRDEFEPEK